MSFDNRTFNVNGELEKKDNNILLQALNLAFATENGANSMRKAGLCAGWRFHPDTGLSLLWSADFKGDNKLPASMGAEEVFPFVLAWLRGEQAKSMKCVNRDQNADHDGHNDGGWRVYFNSGWEQDKADEQFYTICTIRPIFCWYGK